MASSFAPSSIGPALTSLAGSGATPQLIGLLGQPIRAVLVTLLLGRFRPRAQTRLVLALPGEERRRLARQHLRRLDCRAQVAAALAQCIDQVIACLGRQILQ